MMVEKATPPTTFDREFFLSLSINEQFELLKEIVKQGEFETVPQDLLNEGNMIFDENKRGTVLHMLAKSHSQRDLIPQHLLTERALSIRYHYSSKGVVEVGQRLIEELASQRAMKLIPKESLTQNLLESNISARRTTVLNYLANTKQFEHVPKEKLTNSNIHLKDESGNTLLESLWEEQITLVPGNLLLQEDLTKTAHSGDTVLQTYIRKNKIHEIKREFINKDTLLLENPSKVSGLMTTIAYGYYEYIPKELLTKENILKENLEEENCVDVAFKNLIQTDKKEDQNYYLKTCLALLKPLPPSYINTLENRLTKKYNPTWKEASGFLQTILKTEKSRRAKETIDNWLKTKEDQCISI
jgi:hypothetical protein